MCVAHRGAYGSYSGNGCPRKKYSSPAHPTSFSPRSAGRRRIRAMRRVLLLISCAWPLAAPAQTVFKCLDERQRITYPNVAGDKQGLKDGGQVADRPTTLPLPAQKPAPTPAAAPKAEPPKDSESAPGGAQARPLSPLI